MAGFLKLSHQAFKRTMKIHFKNLIYNNILKTLINKVDSKQEQMVNIIRDGYSKKGQKEIL